jgi:flagellar hook-length control protein FliK
MDTTLGRTGKTVVSPPQTASEPGALSESTATGAQYLVATNPKQNRTDFGSFFAKVSDSSVKTLPTDSVINASDEIKSAVVPTNTPEEEMTEAQAVSQNVDEAATPIKSGVHMQAAENISPAAQTRTDPHGLTHQKTPVTGVSASTPRQQSPSEDVMRADRTGGSKQGKSSTVIHADEYALQAFFGRSPVTQQRLGTPPIVDTTRDGTDAPATSSAPKEQSAGQAGSDRAAMPYSVPASRSLEGNQYPSGAPATPGTAIHPGNENPLARAANQPLNTVPKREFEITASTRDATSPELPTPWKSTKSVGLSAVSQPAGSAVAPPTDPPKSGEPAEASNAYPNNPALKTSQAAQKPQSTVQNEVHSFRSGQKAFVGPTSSRSVGKSSAEVQIRNSITKPTSPDRVQPPAANLQGSAMKVMPTSGHPAPVRVGDRSTAGSLIPEIQTKLEGAHSLLVASDTLDMAAWESARVASNAVTAPLRSDLAPHVARQMIEVMAQAAHRPTEIALSPQELGRVRMSVVTEDGSITVNIIAERPETLDLMRRHIDQLGQTFKSMGYESINFAFGQGADSGEQNGTGPNGDQSGGTDSKLGNHLAGSAEEAAVIHLEAASTRGVDIRL